MPFLSNAHTHTTYCDGCSPIEETLARAAALGFVSLGFSGHAHQGFDPAYSMALDGQAAYFRDLRRLQAHPVEGQPRLWVGLELDALADESLRKAAYDQSDYIIGSTHYLTAEPGGAFVAVDGPADLLGQYVNQQFAGDGLAAARAYYTLEVNMLLRDRPAIIGHFDLLRKHAATLGLFQESDPAYQKIALSALEAAYPCGGVLEVNTGGMARGYLPTPYPTLNLLCAWREMGGRVTLTSDCHDARYLDYAFDDGMALIRQAGFHSLLRLGTGDALWDEVDVYGL